MKQSLRSIVRVTSNGSTSHASVVFSGLNPPFNLRSTVFTKTRHWFSLSTRQFWSIFMLLFGWSCQTCWFSCCFWMLSQGEPWPDSVVCCFWSPVPRHVVLPGSFDVFWPMNCNKSLLARVGGPWVNSYSPSKLEIVRIRRALMASQIWVCSFDTLYMFHWFSILLPLLSYPASCDFCILHHTPLNFTSH